jgi:hypothetical protein
MHNYEITLKRFKNLILLIFIFTIIRLFEYRFEFNLPLVRYSIISLCTFFLLTTISIKESFKYRFKGITAFLIFILFSFWLYSIFLGLPDITDPNINYIKLKQFIGEKVLLFSLPLLLFIRPEPEYLRVFIKYAYILLYALIPFLILDLSPFLTRENSPEGLIRATAGVSGFLLLISHYFKTLKKIFILIIYLISLLFMLYHARRNMVLYFGSFFIFYCYINLFSNTILINSRRWKNVLNIFFFTAMGGIVFLLSNPDFSLFIEKSSRGMESREGLIEQYFRDISPWSNDFFTGRGMFGTFFSTLNVSEEDKIGGGGLRDLIENGYLQLILNFGFIYLFSFILISLITFYRGFFKSNNLLAKSCAALIFINLIDMIGWGLPELSFRYFLVCFSFSFCLSNNFRNYSDLKLKNFVN